MENYVKVYFYYGKLKGEQMKRAMFAIVLLIASVVWGQTQINPDSLKILEQGKNVILPIIRGENNWGVNPLTFAHPKMILGDEFKKVLDSYLLDLLKEYKADCVKDSVLIYETGDIIPNKVIKIKGGGGINRYWDDLILRYAEKDIYGKKPVSFEGFINWFERRVK
jgi:hypothetical protein